jgi:thiol-disulfide isomerase/thioredoxin
MVFLHIDTKNYEEKDGNRTLIDKLNNIIHSNKNKVFILYYMEGCGPCNATRPEWEKLKNVLKNTEKDENIAIVDIDQVLSSKLKGLKEPNSFPTIRFVTDSGNVSENYEDSELPDEEKNRTIDSFVKWITLKTGQQIQKGGVLLDAKDDEAFKHFIENATFSYLSKGAFGITFKATLKDGIISKYKRLESGSTYEYGDEVRTIIIKFGFVHDSSKGQTETTVKLSEDKIFDTVELQSFKDEVNIQTDIFLKTMNYLQPICPAIVYSSVYTDIDGVNGLNYLFEIMYKGSENTATRILIQNMYKSKQKLQFYNIGVIAMEFADGYVLLYNLNKDLLFDLYKDMTLYLLLKLALDTGYTHGDFHPGNIFINTKYKNYFKGLNGKPLLIDFGQAQKIPIDMLKFMKEKCNNGNYTEALKKLCEINRPDGIVMNEFNTFYGFACGSYDFKKQVPITEFPKKINPIINMLFQEREKSIDDMINLFKRKNTENPKKYPLLPLSNAVKNKMYSGLITGGKRGRNNRQFKKTNNNTRKGGKWSLKYKRSINCNHPKGFSQKQHCKYGRK